MVLLAMVNMLLWLIRFLPGSLRPKKKATVTDQPKCDVTRVALPESQKG